MTLKQPIFHVVEMLASMGDHFLILPEVTHDCHVVSGMAALCGGELRILLYSHNERDVQARSGQSFHVALRLENFPWKDGIEVRQYHVDRDHNSFYRLRERLGSRAGYSPQEIRELQWASQLHATSAPSRLRPYRDKVDLEVRLSNNGLCFLLLNPAAGPAD